MPEKYQMRGNRVQPLSVEDISCMAEAVQNVFNFSSNRRRRLDKSFEMLSEYSITLSIHEDSEWLFFTKGHCDPSTATISIPNSIYINACKGERDALAVVLHEMGHLFLGHKAILHFSDSEPVKEEDAEWQADTFADVILTHMGYRLNQLSFDFYM